MSEFVKPIGELAERLVYFEAPEDAQRKITRRVGNLVGSRALSVGKVEGIIFNSMEHNAGLPNWGEIDTQIGEVANKTYRKLKTPGAKI